MSPGFDQLFALLRKVYPGGQPGPDAAHERPVDGPRQALRPPGDITSDPSIHESTDPIALAHLADRRASGEGWAGRLTLFLRAAAALSLAEGLYRWAAVCGLGAGSGGFEARSSPWQTATVFFAVIDLVAAVGLWLGAFWGVVIWLASSVTSIVVHALLPQIYGFQPIIIAGEVALIIAYSYIAFEAAREQVQ